MDQSAQSAPVHVKIETFVPPDAAAAVAAALAQAGLCAEGSYDHVYALLPAEGHWRPLAGAHPAIGSVGSDTAAREVKLEFRCLLSQAADAAAAIRRAHPYEVPVINVLPLLEF